MFSTTGFERTSQFLFLSPLHPHPMSYMASDKALLVSGWPYQIKKELQMWHSVQPFSLPSSGNPRVSLIIPGCSVRCDRPRDGKNVWFSPSAPCRDEIDHWCVFEPVTCYCCMFRLWGYKTNVSAAVDTPPSDHNAYWPLCSVWVFSTPTRWCPVSETSL